jgi:hypothetical protein
MLPHHSSSRSTQLHEDSTSVACADRERAHQLGVSSKGGGAPFIEEGFILAEEKGLWEFQVLGFLSRCLGIILGGFSESFSGGSICIESGTFSQEEGTPLFGGYS